jgi:leucyl aminopeptidase
MIEGFLLADYQYRRFLTSGRPVFEIQHLSVIYSDKCDRDALLNPVFSQIEAVNLVRDLVNGPANLVNIQFMEDTAKKICQDHHLEFHVKQEETLKKEGFNLILAVGQGAKEKPRLIEMKYRSSKDHPHICLVGKGVIFDTGGLNIKTENHMNDMKQDMAGAALVIGALQAAARLKLKVNITGLIPLVENAVDALSYRPGDIILGYGKKTVEILNTDAEGRLILADALAYSDELHPDLTMDFATLTGAAVVALGTKMGACFFRNDKTRDKIMESSRFTGEPLWELPLFEPYKEHLAGDIADLGNIGNPPRQAGTIMGALFLSEFIKNTDWSHFDIAGPAFFDKEYSYHPKGGTGFLLRTLIHFLQNYSG